LAFRLTVLLSFKAKYKESPRFGESSILEAKVVRRNKNVQVHAEITKATNELVSAVCSFLEKFTKKVRRSSVTRLLLKHGWMGG
jgi:acyl-coenzyme A thioesterase PaaI-like protein